MPKYRGAYRDKLGDPDPVPGEEQLDQQTQQDDNLPASNPEEETWKKRYGDLRRHAQKTDNAAKAEIESLRRQLVEATHTQWKLPKTDEELETFYKQYPDGAAFMESIAAKMADRKLEEMKDTYGKQLEDLNAARHQTEHERAKQKLIQLHPDFEKIRQDPEFHKWVQEQPKSIQDSLYENDTDAHAAARSVDLYKADMAKKVAETKGKTERPKPDAGAASFVSPSKPASEPTTTNDGKKIWKESEIKAIPRRAYTDEVDAEVTLAWREGRVIQDLTRNRGVAR